MSECASGTRPKQSSTGAVETCGYLSSFRVRQPRSCCWLPLEAVTSSTNTTRGATLKTMPAEPPTDLTKEDLEEMLQCGVESFTTSPLTTAGENFGSLLLRVDATLLPDHRQVSLAAKLVVTKNLMGRVPPFRDFMRKEMDMYTRLRPAILAVQEEHGIPRELLLDVIPRCHGARTRRGGGLEPPVDETAAILMENLGASGYRLADRIEGMDLEHAECVVKHLARFQAMFVVFKLKKPHFFKSAVLPTASQIVHEGPPQSPSHQPDPETSKLNCVLCVPAVVEHADRIKIALKKGRSLFMQKSRPEPAEPFATVVHNDFWTNNVMFSYGEGDEGKISSLKLLDFQMTNYGSPVTDLIFFLYSSTSLDVTREDRDRLIKLYHQEFTGWLELFGCDTKPFGYETFMKEVEAVAPFQFDRTFSMLRIFCMSKSNPPDINNPAAFHRMKTDNTGLGEQYFKKIERIVVEFVDRGWI
ncbi:uncharacterized protein LOC134538965 [Bacillus rossius redtenbacheri]|uniref:uncharacterized protein LOC134538965 n=1 Tax=Bacillus rossius redtenbacheri TaxID=93214 RepID=UPI002FDDC8A9